MKRTALIFTALIASTAMFAQKSWDLKNFPEGSRPEEIGTKLVEHYLDTPHSHWGDINSKYEVKLITYPDVCAWLGSLWFAKATENEGLYEGLVERFEPLFGEQKNLQPAMFPKEHNVVDFYVFGAVPLEIYKTEREQRYLDLGLKYADGQWVMPPAPTQEQRGWQEKGYSWQTRLWVDDMFMITELQAQAYEVTGDRKYIDRAAEEMCLYLDEIQRPNGLFYHHTGTPYFWGRGDGWMAVGMTELLKNLPENDPNYKRIYKGYRVMMESLKKYINQDGVWNQLIDVKDCWTESSGSAMFAYAMIMGVKNGWLEAEEYGPIARRAWITLCNFIDDNNDVTEVCIGTGKKNSYQYYLDRPRIAGDYHGQAPMIWCATALLEE